MIEERKLKPGTVLGARYKGRAYRAEVVAGEDGKARYRLGDGREFTSPSAAGSAVMGGVACNGWRFWSLAGAGEKKPVRSPKKRVKTSARFRTKTRAPRPVATHRNGQEPEVRRRGRR